MRVFQDRNKCNGPPSSPVMDTLITDYTQLHHPHTSRANNTDSHVHDTLPGAMLVCAVAASRALTKIGETHNALKSVNPSAPRHTLKMGVMSLIAPSLADTVSGTVMLKLNTSASSFVCGSVGQQFDVEFSWFEIGPGALGPVNGTAYTVLL